jgi:16S rRNA (guanine527-N7)-methyltransferase
MSAERSAGTDPLRTLAGRHGLNAAQLAQLAAVLEKLHHDGHAPTAVRDANEAVDVHIADSLVALELGAIRTAVRIADIGTGAGFPGVALAIALPSAEITLVESKRRKCDFLDRMCVDAEIGNAQVVCSRVEEWGEGVGANDAVVARALATPAVVLEYAAPLLRLGGTLVDWRGARRLEDERCSLSAADELGMQRTNVLKVEPFPGVRDHYLHVYAKVRDTPGRFPRRAGVARKHPLGSGRAATAV